MKKETSFEQLEMVVVFFKCSGGIDNLRFIRELVKLNDIFEVLLDQ